MSFINKYEQWFKRLLPAPFVIAILLTLLTVVLALLFGKANGINLSIVEIALQWEEGLWNNSLLVFAFQMMFMLVLGHTLALSKPVSWLIERITRHCTSTPIAALIVTLSTILVGFVNWGLALIFGAILARKVGEYCKRNDIPLNYPLIGACGYTGLLVWHGGLSGSSLLKINEIGHLRSLSSIDSSAIPSSISISDTIFSSMNLTVGFLLVILLPLGAYLIGKKTKNSSYTLREKEVDISSMELPQGMEKLTFSKYFGKAIGLIIILVAGVKSANYAGTFLGFVNPNFINLCLFGLALLFHKSILKFLGAVENAISGAAGILIQFPLYFGIMAIMTQSSLVSQFSHMLVEHSTQFTYPIFTFISAAVVNVFVPSGGGQWAIQGPIIVESYLQSGIPLEKSILAMAYGDELTNMLQPFWALPLLGITGLKAKEIIPYTLIFLGIAAVVFLGALVVF
jgi:short-chain fatty acids transporter